MVKHSADAAYGAGYGLPGMAAGMPAGRFGGQPWTAAMQGLLGGAGGLYGAAQQPPPPARNGSQPNFLAGGVAMLL